MTRAVRANIPRLSGALPLCGLLALAAACTVESGSAGRPADTTKPGPCGGVTCKAEEFCRYPVGDCGKGAATGATDTGTCDLRPTACADNDAHPVCACDGKAYASPCEAAQAGLSIGDGEECAVPPPGAFACGFFFCESGAEWCELLDDPYGLVEGVAYDCEEIPPACVATPSCDCLTTAINVAGGPCAGPPSCTQDSEDNLVLECQGAIAGG